MNKKKRLVLLGLITGMTCVTAAGFLSVDISSTFATRSPEPFSCSEYWDNDEYKSLYKISHDSSYVNQEVKTWGTVSEIFSQSGYTNFFIQSTDRSGHKAGVLVYQPDQSVATSIEKGNVVTVSGTYSLYNGCQEIKDATTVVDHEENLLGPIVPNNYISEYWNFSNLGEMRDYYNELYGYIDKINVVKIGSNYFGEFTDGTQAPLYIKNNMTGASDIKNTLDGLTDVTNHTVSIYGIFEYYSKSTTMQLQILREDSIVFEPPVVDIKIEDISFDVYLNSVTVGETLQLTPTITPSNATNKTLSWVSDDENVATVDSNGLVTGVSAGTTYIIVEATDGSDQYSYCRIDVTSAEILVESIELDVSEITIEVSSSYTLYATVYPIDAINKTVSWSTTNSSIATVDDYGTVTGVAPGNAYIYAESTDGSNKYASCYVTVEASEEEADSITFDLTAINPGSYSTGNYGSKTVSGYEIGYYRATSGMNLLPKTTPGSTYGDGGLDGFVQNNTPIGGISSITINYYTYSTTGVNPVIKYGSDLSFSSSKTVPFSSTHYSYTIETTGDTQYFRISCGDSQMYLSSILVEYDKDITPSSPSYINPINSSTRINPTKFSGTLVPGESQVTVPYKGSTKTFTYYTEEYIYEHPEYLNDAALTKPEDISAYVIAFNEWPANVKTSRSDVFGNLTRRLSKKYTRTDGYATSVPYNVAEYYEIDIDIDGTYTTSNRGVGRVVVWMHGFNSTGYDSSIVCTYTDDHYATFQEYANNGYFMPRFNAEQPFTKYSRVA